MLMITFCWIVNVPLSLYCQIGIVLPTIFDFTNCKKQAFGKSCLVGFCMYHKLLQRRIQRHWNTRILPRMAMTVIILLLQWQQEQPRTKHSSFFCWLLCAVVYYLVLLYIYKRRTEWVWATPSHWVPCPKWTSQDKVTSHSVQAWFLLCLAGANKGSCIEGKRACLKSKVCLTWWKLGFFFGQWGSFYNQ